MRLSLINLDLKGLIVLFLGIFSTFQFPQLFGFSFFTVLLILYFFVCLFTSLIIKEHNFKSLLVLLIFCVSISEVNCLISDNYTDWAYTSIKKYFLFLLVIFLSFYIKGKNKYIEIFIRGVYVSCIIQLFWCLAQFVLFRFFRINLNLTIFTGIFGIQESVAHVKNGIVYLSGLNSNVGMMVPVILFALVLTKNNFYKLLVTIIAITSGSSTPILAVVFFWILSYLLKFRDGFRIRINSNYLVILIIILILMLSVIMFTDLGNIIQDQLNKLYDRLYSVLNNNITDSSTYAHFRYYSAAPHILEFIELNYILFGFGTGCAGIPFIMFFNQYSDLHWLPESDFITYLFNFGILGLLIFYSIIFLIIYRAYTNRFDKCFLFFASILFAGFFYGIQLNWVRLIEFIAFGILISKYSFDIFELKPNVSLKKLLSKSC